MADSPPWPVPEGSAWSAGPGGARVLRAPGAAGAVLVVRTASREHRIEGAPGGTFRVPAELATAHWERAWLEAPGGERTPVPEPPHAEVIDLDPTALAERRARRESVAGGDAVRGGVVGASRGETVAGVSPGETVAGASRGETSAGVSPGETGAGASRGETVAGVSPGETGAGVSPGETGAGVSPPADGAAEPARTESGSWTAPPEVVVPSADASESEWLERRAALERELARAAEALASARDSERAARDAVVAALAGARADLRAVRAAREAEASAIAALAGELDAERAAHAVTRGSLGTLADALAEARAEAAAARDEAATARSTGDAARAHLAGARRDAAVAAAEAAGLRADLAAERSERANLETELREAREGSPLLAKIADLDRAAAGLRDRVELERRAREQAEASAAAARRSPEQTGRLLADLDAAAAALRGAAPPADDASEAAPPGADISAADASEAAPPGDDTSAADPEAATPGADTSAADPEAAPPGDDTSAADPEAAPPGGDTSAADPEAAPPGGDTSAAAEPPAAAEPTRELAPATGDRPLRRALLALAHEDPVGAGEVLAGLLPAQGRVVGGPLTYDLTIRGVATFAVSIDDHGDTRVQRLSRRRTRAEAPFHVLVDPPTLAALLAGEERRVGRFRRRGVKVSGKRKRARALRPLTTTDMSLADALQAGARLGPALVYRVLPFAIEPEWTRGHSFTVAQQVAELAPRTWYITAADGARLTVSEDPPAERPVDATVSMSRATFDRLLGDEPPEPGKLPTVRGDRDAVARLKAWSDRVRRG